MEKIDKWTMLLIGLVGGWLIATFPGWVEAWATNFWWDIATAFGTVGAVAVALTLALRDSRERRRLRAQQGLILGWIMSPELGDVAGGLNSISTILARMRQVPLGIPLTASDRQLLAWGSEKLGMPSSRGLLGSLHVLDERKSFAFAAILGKTASLQAQLAWLSTIDMPKSDLLEKQLQSYELAVQDIRADIRSAGYPVT